MQNVNWTLHTGVCYGLLGENGAGKSTLIKILTGIYSPSEGEIYWKGSLCEHLDPDSASHLGITAVHQELTLVDTLSISNNIFLGNEPTTRRGFVDVSEMNRRSKALLESWGMYLDVSMNVSLLSLADIEDYCNRILDVLRDLGKPCTLRETTDTLHERFYPHNEYSFQLFGATHTHLQYLKRKDLVTAIAESGRLKWRIL